MGAEAKGQAASEREAGAIRELAILWPNDLGGCCVRILLDDGEGCPLSARYRWQDGTPVRVDELERVAKALERAGSGGEGEANRG
jgi:hypothetical protein